MNNEQISIEQMLKAFPHETTADWQLFALVGGTFRFQRSCPRFEKAFSGNDLRQVITAAYNELKGLPFEQEGVHYHYKASTVDP